MERWFGGEASIRLKKTILFPEYIAGYQHIFILKIGRDAILEWCSTDIGNRVFKDGPTLNTYKPDTLVNQMPWRDVINYIAANRQIFTSCKNTHSPDAIFNTVVFKAYVFTAHLDAYLLLHRRFLTILLRMMIFSVRPLSEMIPIFHSNPSFRPACNSLFRFH